MSAEYPYAAKFQWYMACTHVQKVASESLECLLHLVSWAASAARYATGNAESMDLVQIYSAAA